MDVRAFLQAGRPDEALAAAQAEVRQRPGDVNLRVHLYALECVLGHYEKALSHLQTIATLSPEWVLPAHVQRLLIGCESMRRDVFAGRRRPLLLGEPPPWLGWCLEAFAMESQGHSEEAWQLRAKAFDEAPALEVRVNGQARTWLSDVDLRMGSVLEAYLEGTYYWIPFTHLRQFTTQAPQVLTELLWLPAKLLLTTDAEVDAFLPVRYPGTEEAADGELRLARRTEFKNVSGGSVALGQKLLESDAGEIGLLECRTIEFGPPGPS